ncbi:MAG: hypothetical protein OXL34_12705 [Gemmatimonadota bacterium]|nr:hypothetical protein [Gemmatimonadota bacterium]
MDHVKTAVSGLNLDEPTTHGGLTVFPLTTGFRSKLRYLLLEEGLRKDLVTIREVSEGGSVPELKVRNRADRPVLIVDGEELVGAKQNRVANLTMLIPAERTTIIPVSCVEAGRWSYRTPHFDVTDRVQNARGRAEKLESVRHSIRERGSRRSDQGRVWDSIEEEADVLGAPSPTSEMGAMFDRHRDTLDDYVRAVEPASEQVGAVFIVGGRRYGLDLFDRAATLAAFLPKLVRSYAIDVLGRRPLERGESLEGEARGFLNRIVDGTYDDHPAVGLGRDVGVVGEGLVAGALVTGRTVVHLTAFAQPVGVRQDPAAGRSSGGRYANYRQRLDSLRSRYER